jgi:hypothetical protein
MKITLLTFSALTLMITSTPAQTTPNLQLDTISIRGGSLRDHYVPDFKFDSIVVELYLSGSRLAVIPKEFQSYINKELIEETEMSSETYNGNKVLLRIQMFVRPEQRKKNR